MACHVITSRRVGEHDLDQGPWQPDPPPLPAAWQADPPPLRTRYAPPPGRRAIPESPGNQTPPTQGGLVAADAGQMILESLGKGLTFSGCAGD